MSQINVWIDHLNEPLVLVGFLLFLTFGLFKFFLKQLRIFSNNYEKIFQRILNYALILGLLIILLGFWFASNKISKAKHSEGNQSPIIEKINGDLEITFQGSSNINNSNNKNSDKKISGDSQPLKIRQHTEGNQSPIINSGNNVNIHYREKK